MELKAKLDKPYSEFERADFIVENNHNKGYEIKEVEAGLEAWGNTEEEQKQKDYDSKCLKVREKRKTLLEESDLFMLIDRYNKLSTEQQEELVKYRQDLRDVTSQEGFPETIVWPTRPEWFDNHDDE